MLERKQSMNTYNHEFWNTLDKLVQSSENVIDRPKGSAHPRYAVYERDFN